MKSKKQKKNKLSGLLLLLLLTIICFGVSTYAWFTSNETVRVDNIEVNVATASGIQISTDAVNWKTLISNTDITTGYVGDDNQLPTTAANAYMTNVSTAGNLLSNGHLDMYKGAVKANAEGVFEFTAEADRESKGTTGDFVAFDIFLKLDETEAKPIYFTTSTGVTDTESSGLVNSSRVAFIVEGNQDATVAATNALNLKTTDTSNVYIWEPAPYTHIQKGMDNAQTNYSDLLTGITLSGNMASKLPYDGVAQEITTPIVLTKTNHVSDSGANADYFTPVETVLSQEEGQVWFNLQPGITKIRVYFWIEGQDVDCENTVSGHNISLDFGFSLLTQTEQAA